jgi:tetratricopeptide (TPR) repeat protein
MQQALAFIPLQKYEDALAVLRKSFWPAIRRANRLPPRSSDWRTIYQKTNKTADAIKSFQERARPIRRRTPQAEQAAFWVGQMSFASGDSKSALEEFKTFLRKFPHTELAPRDDAVYRAGSGLSWPERLRPPAPTRPCGKISEERRGNG